MDACGRRLETGGDPLQWFLNSSTCWHKSAPAETGGIAPNQQSFKLISLNVPLPVGVERLLNKVLVTRRIHGIHHSQVQRENSNGLGTYAKAITGLQK